MMKIAYTFETVKIKGTRTILGENGKRKKQSKTFSQTINPYNRNAAGEPKTRLEIMAELIARREEWARLEVGNETNDKTH